MTVRELVAFLNTQDPERLVFTCGYEGGYDDVTTDVKTVDVVLNYHTEWYYGKHELIENVSKKTLLEYEVAKGIVI
jgi:hypothetical protein